MLASMDAKEKTLMLDRYQELFERSADAILIIEHDRFVDCNRAAVAMLRCASREQVLQTHPSELSPPTQPDGRSSFEKANEMMALAKTHGSHRFEWQHKRRDGEVFPVEVLLTAVEGGSRSCIHVVWRDITERWQLEEQVRQSQKMQAVGRLAGGIAHDFNNLLVVIFGNCSLLERRVADDSVLKSIQEIRVASEKATALVRQLMSFSRSRAPTTEVISLGRALDSLAPLMRQMISEDISLSVSSELEGYVLIDPSQFDQVLLNLVSNARDAMPDGGVLEVSTSITSALSTSAMPADLPSGDYVHVQVRDTGQGMNATQKSRAFDPFYTTKPVGQGTGFGLATVYGIVTQSGGHVSIETAVGQGTTIHMYFPASQKNSGEVVGSLSLGGDAVRGTERILVVEDEAPICRLLHRELTRLGYQVEVASDGRKGLERLRDHGVDYFDLVISDVRMPGLGGPAMMRELQWGGQEPSVLYITGYEGRALDAIGEEAVDLLYKPFTLSQLAQRVRQALGVQDE